MTDLTNLNKLNSWKNENEIHLRSAFKDYIMNVETRRPWHFNLIKKLPKNTSWSNPTIEHLKITTHFNYGKFVIGETYSYHKGLILYIEPDNVHLTLIDTRLFKQTNIIVDDDLIGNTVINYDVRQKDLFGQYQYTLEELKQNGMFVWRKNKTDLISYTYNKKDIKFNKFTLRPIAADPSRIHCTKGTVVRLYNDMRCEKFGTVSDYYQKNRISGDCKEAKAAYMKLQRMSKVIWNYIDNKEKPSRKLASRGNYVDFIVPENKDINQLKFYMSLAFDVLSEYIFITPSCYFVNIDKNLLINKFINILINYNIYLRSNTNSKISYITSGKLPAFTTSSVNSKYEEYCKSVPEEDRLSKEEFAGYFT